MDEKEWEVIKIKSRGYVWGMQWVERKNKKGRAMGGMLMGIRKELIDKGKEIESVGKGLLVGIVREEKRILISEEMADSRGICEYEKDYEGFRGMDGREG